MPHLSARLSDYEARQVAEIAKARGVKGRSAVVRALIAEEHARVSKSDGPAEVADFSELEKLLTTKAREGNVAAMKELRALLERRDRERADREREKADKKPEAEGGDGPGASVTPLDAIRQRAARG